MRRLTVIYEESGERQCRASFNLGPQDPIEKIRVFAAAGADDVLALLELRRARKEKAGAKAGRVAQGGSDGSLG